MRMVVRRTAAKRLDCRHDAGPASGLLQHLTVEPPDRLGRAAREQAQQTAVPEEEGTDPFRHGERDHPVRNRFEKILHKPLAPEGQLLRVTARAESSLARKSNEKLRLAPGTYDPSEPVFEDAAVEELVDGPSCDLRSQGSVLVSEALFIGEEELLEVVFEESVEGGSPGTSRLVGRSGGRLLLADRAGGGLHRAIRFGTQGIRSR